MLQAFCTQYVFIVCLAMYFGTLQNASSLKHNSAKHDPSSSAPEHVCAEVRDFIFDAVVQV